MTPAQTAPRILVGQVWHERRTPAVHRFRYRMWWADLDLDRLGSTTSALRLLARHRGRPLRFERTDYLGDPDTPLADAVRDLVEARTGTRPAGSVRLVGHLRTWGWCFNPIVIYLCFDLDHELQWVVADVTNTPWKERHQYVLPAGPAGVHDHIEAKRLHVSPFMEMDQQYRFTVESNDIRFHLRVDTLTPSGEPFSAGVELSARPMTDRALFAMLLRHPFLTMRVSLGIHTQAVRLWRKRVPVQPHPEQTSRPQQVMPR